MASSRIVPPFRVLFHGLPYFADMLNKLLEGENWNICRHPGKNPLDLIALVRDLHRCPLTYKIGGRIAGSRFLQAARLLGKDKVIIHWVGSDVLFAQRYLSLGGKPDPWVVRTAYHWAEVAWIAEEVRQMGLKCDVVPLTSAHVPVQPVSLPEEFSVLVYLPSLEKAELYGLNTILQVARDLPSVKFLAVGLRQGRIPGAPPNLKDVGSVPDLTSIYRDVTVLWRPTSHDGLSFMVLEALGFGRHVLWSHDFPGCIRVAGLSDARRELQRLSELHQRKCLQINEVGLHVMAEEYHPQRIKKEILKRFEWIILSG